MSGWLAFGLLAVAYLHVVTRCWRHQGQSEALAQANADLLTDNAAHLSTIRNQKQWLVEIARRNRELERDVLIVAELVDWQVNGTARGQRLH